VSFKKVLAILFGLLVLGMLSMGVLVAVFLPRYVHGAVQEQARRRGIALEPGDISVGLGWLQIKDSKVSLVGVPAIQATVGIIDVELDGLTPKRFTLNRASIQLTGEATVQEDLASWLRAHQSEFSEPVFVKPLSVEFRQAAKGDPALRIADGELSADRDHMRLNARELALASRKLGAMRLSAKKDSAELGITLGISELDNPILSVEARTGETRNFHAALSPVALGRLGAALQLELPLPLVIASGTFDAELPRVMTPLSHPSGRTDITLKGYVPPHPLELDGFVFGDSTEFSSRYTVFPEQLRVAFEDMRVKAGSFELKGTGSLGMDAGGPSLRMNLTGSLPCAALASAAAETRLGKALGRLTGKAAREALNGGVTVKVSVQASLLALDKPRILKTITPGCGLKPLTLGELRALGELLPSALDPAVGDDLAKLLKGPLPALPNLGPGTQIDLSQLGALPLPKLPLPPASASKQAVPPPAASSEH